MTSDPEQIYLDGYAAFEGGDYAKAVDLATKCMNAADVDSYWYAGAIGLRCWAANYLGDSASVVRDASVLLFSDTGDDKMWFDGLAVLNLALIRRRLGDVGDAEMLFDLARAKYSAYRIDSEKPAEWSLIKDLFEAITLWAAAGETDKLENLAQKLKASPGEDGERAYLARAVDLYLREANGEDVTADAADAAQNGVSRAFLALILI